MALGFTTFDVFTNQAFGGNPLAVIADGRGVTDETMAAITREFNYSETTFVLPPRDPAHTAQVRIFTPGGEIPFAGHPNVGTAFCLAQAGSCFGRPVGDRLVFEEVAGLVVVDIDRGASGQATGATLHTPQGLTLGATAPVDAVAQATGLAQADIDVAAHPPTEVSVGLGFWMVRLASMDALARAEPLPTVPPALAASTGLHLYVPTPGDAQYDVRTRMFAPAAGVAEDPATGSANAALCAYLAHLQGTDGTLTRRIAQGVEMGRPSLLHAEADVAGGEVQAVRIGGGCVPVMTGKLTVPQAA